MSTSGLTSKEERALRDLLQRAEDLAPGRAYVGGGQWQDLETLTADLKRRLDPEAADVLAERAERMIAPLAAAIAESRRSMTGTLEGADAA